MNKKEWYKVEEYKLIQDAYNKYKELRADWAEKWTMNKEISITPEMRELLVLMKNYIIKNDYLFKEFQDNERYYNYKKDAQDAWPSMTVMYRIRNIVWVDFEFEKLTPEEKEKLVLCGHNTVEESLKQLATDLLTFRAHIDSDFFNKYLTVEQANNLVDYVIEAEKNMEINEKDKYIELGVDYLRETFMKWISMVAPLTEDTILKYKDLLHIRSFSNNKNIKMTPTIELLIEHNNKL